MDAGLYPLRGERLPDPVAISHPDGVQVPYRLDPGADAGRDERQGRKGGVVGGGVAPPSGVPAIEMWQLDAEHCGLEGVETAVVADDIRVVLGALAVVAQQPAAVRYGLAVGDHHPTVALGS